MGRYEEHLALLRSEYSHLSEARKFSQRIDTVWDDNRERAEMVIVADGHEDGNGDGKSIGIKNA